MLASAVVHCSREYVPGLIYVAVLRATSPDDTQILNFYPWLLFKPHQKVVDMCISYHIYTPAAELSCSYKRSYNDHLLKTVTDHFDVCEDDGLFTFSSNVIDGPV